MFRLFKKKKNLGLALGAGSARGLAHIGVLKVLAEANVPIKAIAGTSAGALVGGLFAAGVTAEELERVLVNEKYKILSKVFVPTFPRGGLFDGRRVSEFVRLFTDDVQIEDLKIPFAAVATDFMTGEEVVIRQGSLAEAIRASTCLPGVFTPPRLSGRILCDGGLVNPVPVDVCRSLGADFVVAVNVNPRLSLISHDVSVQTIKEEKGEKKRKIEEKLLPLLEQIDKGGELSEKVLDWLKPHKREGKEKPPFGILEAMTQAFSIVYARNLYFRSTAAKPDMILEPNTRGFSAMDFDEAEALIDIGEQCARENLDVIMKSFIS